MRLFSRISVIIVFLSIIVAADIQAEQKPASSGKNYCIECHTSLKDKNSLPVSDWSKSVHAAAGNECNMCHGGDPSVSDKLKAKSKAHDFIGRPDKNVVIDSCGKGGCHSVQLNQFKRGPHYKSVLKTGHPNCSDCHGSHSVKHASIDLIKGSSCSQSQCHNADYSREIVDSINNIEKDIRTIEKRIDELKDFDTVITGIPERITTIKRLFHELIHVFSNDDIKFTKRIIELEIKNLDSETASKLAQAQRLDILYNMMVGFTMTVVLGVAIYILYMYTRRKF